MANLTYGQIETVWNQAGGNPQAAATAAAIALAESSGNPDAVNSNSNGSIDRGLWQINSVHGSQSTFDLMGNARAAIAISQNGSNFRPWCTAWTNGCKGTYAPTSPSTPSGKRYQGGAAAAPVDTAIADSGTSTSPFTADFWTHSIDNIANWLFYMSMVAAGAALLGIGIVLLMRDTPAGRITVNGLKGAAKVLPFIA